jgi:hypothetical protein
MTTLKALVATVAYQTTEWAYGITTASGSKIITHFCFITLKQSFRSSSTCFIYTKSIFLFRSLNLHKRKQPGLSLAEVCLSFAYSAKSLLQNYSSVGAAAGAAAGGVAEAAKACA